MKRLLMIVLVISAFACSDDDNDNVGNNGIANPYTGSVVGTWITNGITINGNSVQLDCDNETVFEDNYTFIFNEDNSFDIYHNCYPEDGIYNSGTYTTTGNVLTLNMDGQTGKAHMVKAPDEMNLEFRFTIGSEGLFYNYSIFTEKL